MNYLQKNLDAIKQVDKALYNRLVSVKDPGRHFKIIKTRNNMVTFALNVNGREKLINSKYNPMREAEDYIKSCNPRAPKIAMFLGFGVGFEMYALSRIKNLGVCYYLIVEKNINTFIAALQYFDYSDIILQNRLTFIVDIPDDQLYLSMRGWFDHFDRKLYVKAVEVFKQPVQFELDSTYYSRAWEAFHDAAKQVIVHYGNDPKDSLVGIENMLANIVTISKNPGMKDLFGALKGVPAIIVSSGPSLNKNIDQLPALKNKALILCADGSYKALLEKDLHPDMVMSVERIPEVLPFYDDVDAEDMKKTYLAACPVVVPELYDKFKGENIVVYRKFAHFEWLPIDKGIMPVGASVANMGFQIAKNLGCDPIILVGQDLAYGTDGKTHAKGAEYAASAIADRKYQRIPIPANLGGTVFTTPVWFQFLKTFETDIGEYDGTCINATEGGARIAGAEFIPLREAVEKHCQQEFDISKMLKENLHKPENDVLIRDLEKTYEQVKKTNKFVDETIARCDKGIETIINAENDFSKSQYKTHHEIGAEKLKTVLNKVVEIKNEIITKDRMFYLFIMHIVQSYLIRTDIQVNGLWKEHDNLTDIYFHALAIYKDWFPVLKRMLLIIKESVNTAEEHVKAELDKVKEAAGD